MRIKPIVIAFAMFCVAALPCSQASAQNSAPQNSATSIAAASPVTGVWRGQLDGLPAFTLVVTDEGGELQGAILFYMIRRDKPGGAPTATPGIPEPIFHPLFDGKTLRFEVSHRRSHPPKTLNDPPVPFELTLAGDGSAVVRNKVEGMTLTVTHQDY